MFFFFFFFIRYCEVAKMSLSVRLLARLLALGASTFKNIQRSNMADFSRPLLNSETAAKQQRNSSETVNPRVRASCFAV